MHVLKGEVQFPTPLNQIYIFLLFLKQKSYINVFKEVIQILDLVSTLT